MSNETKLPDYRNPDGSMKNAWESSEVMRNFERNTAKNVVKLAKHLESQASVQQVTQDLTRLGPAAQSALRPIKELGDTIEKAFSADDHENICGDWKSDDAKEAVKDLMHSLGAPTEHDKAMAKWKGKFGDVVIYDFTGQEQDDASDASDEQDGVENEKEMMEARAALFAELHELAKEAGLQGKHRVAFEVERTISILLEEGNEDL